MANFSQVAKGTRQLKQISFPTLDGQTASCSIRPLLGSDDALVIAEARAFAISHGLKEPKEGDSLYELGFAVAVLVHACVDTEHPEKAYFDGGAEQILKHLDRERIFLLQAEQERWQDERSPRRTSMSPEEYITEIYRVASAAEGDDLPFGRWRPILQENFVRFMGRLLANLLAGRSHGGSDSDEPSSDTSPSPAN